MNTPWYKQFWPWFLIAIPATSFVMGFTLLHLANNTSDSLVVDDYYKEGKVINMRLDKVEEARRRNITSDLLIDDGAIALTFHSGIPKQAEAIQLAFYHVTLQERDVSILLTRDANGIYRGYTEQSLTGKWEVTLSPLSEKWKIQQTVSLPHSGKIRFNP